MFRIWFLGVFLCAAVGFGCRGGDSGDERGDRCREVRDKLVDLELDRRLRAERTANRPGREARAERHRRNLQQALGESFVERCTREESSRYLACVLEAKDAESARSCRKGGA